MIAGLKPYAAMKETGLPWVPKIPEHWNLLPNRALIRKRKVLVGGRHAEFRLLSLTKAGVIVRDVDSGKGKFSADMGTCQEVRSGDLVFCLFDVPETPRTVGLSKHYGMITGAYTIFECPDQRLASYLELFYKVMDDRKLLSPLYSGLRHTIPPSSLLGIKTPIPPESEQAAIVRFLDHADRRIRRYIRTKQKLIDLLEEQKRAIIHRAVTHGLDPNVRLKPSGVEWLGDVPEHWTVARLGRLINLTTGFPFKSEGFTQLTEDIRLLRGVNISPGKIRWNEVVRWSAADRPQFEEYELRVGDIVLGMDRPIIRAGIRVASLGEADVPSLVLQRVARIRPCKQLRADFLLLLLAGNSFSNYLSPIFTGISVPHLSPEQIKSFQFALPSVEEQKQIVSQLSADTSIIETARDRAQREIALLREYRTRLIADVVTGKLDMRAVVGSLPEPSDEGSSVDSDLEQEGADEYVEGEGLLEEEVEA